MVLYTINSKKNTRAISNKTNEVWSQRVFSFLIIIKFSIEGWLARFSPVDHFIHTVLVHTAVEMRTKAAAIADKTLTLKSNSAPRNDAILVMAIRMELI